jgi:hypothetical protein
MSIAAAVLLLWEFFLSLRKPTVLKLKCLRHNTRLIVMTANIACYLVFLNVQQVFLTVFLSSDALARAEETPAIRVIFVSCFCFNENYYGIL